MSKLNILGLISLIGGGLLLGFQGLATFMSAGTGMGAGTGVGQETAWKSLNLMDIFGEASFNWIDSISTLYVKAAANYVATMPLFILFFCFAALFFIMNMFFRD